MPELPEVETMRRGILQVVGSRITTIRRPRCLRKPIVVRPQIPTFRARVRGKRIDSVGRIGKRVVLHLETADAIIFEPRMTGLVLLADPPSSAHLRFCLELSGGPVDRLWFWDRRGLGSIRLLSELQLTRQFSEKRLGPDALVATVEQLLASFGMSRREIKTALLDQRAVAGIGNLYASEILHVARIHPQMRCHQMTRRHWRQLHDAIRDVLNEAIRFEGSTLSDGTYRNALNQNGSYQNHHRVYGRAGEVCRSCGQEAVRRLVQAQRSTFFCPACQRKSRSSSATKQKRVARVRA